eukprot:evm.model.scf_76.14 EVM.evm.TU.scf_76.14   scf_76:103330-104260(+)
MSTTLKAGALPAPALRSVCPAGRPVEQPRSQCAARARGVDVSRREAVISVVAASGLMLASPVLAFGLRESADVIHEKGTVHAVPELPDWRRLVAIATPCELESRP